LLYSYKKTILEKGGVKITMKKSIKLLAILFLITLPSIGCSNKDERNSKKVAEEFGRNLYTVDAKQVAEYKELTDLSYETIQSLDKHIRPLMTENEYETLVANRQNIMNLQGCAINDYTMQVTDFILTENFYDGKQNKAGYNYEAKLKFIPIHEKDEQTDVGKGYIGLLKENGQWKVYAYKPTTIPKLVMKR
jgi:hypothetical protein